MNKASLPFVLVAMACLSAAGQTTTFELPPVSGVPTLLPVWSGFSPVVQQYGETRVQDTLAGNGSQALEMVPNSAVAWSPDDLTAPSGLVLVSSFQLRLDTLSSDAPVIPPETLSAVVFANASGLMALDGNGAGGGTWQTLLTLAADTLYSITVSRDYGSQTYDVEVDGALVADDFGFKDPVREGPFTATFESSERAWLDDVSADFTDLSTPGPPGIASLSPAHGASGVAVNRDLVLTLNESVQKGTGSIRIKENLGNAIIATIDVTSASVMVSGNVVTIALPTDLGNGTPYYIEIDDGALADLSGNAFGGIAGSATWSFTTAVGSTEAAPVVVGQLGILDKATNGGINPATGMAWAPGDTYRLVFLSSTTGDTTSTDISTYNALVQADANAAGLGSVTWIVIGSTSAVDARDNTKTNTAIDGAGVGIFRMDGGLVAENYADLWDASIANPINIHADGTSAPTLAVAAMLVGTGTNTDGTAFSKFLGGDGASLTRLGNYSTSSNSWMAYTGPANTSVVPFYAMSEVLTVISGPPSSPAVVYEPFDYTPTDGTVAIVGQNSGTGFDGAWTGAGTFANNVVGTGLGFGSLDAAGGSNLRSNRAGTGAISRTITVDAQTALTADNSIIWFGVLMDPTGFTGSNTSTDGYAANSYGTLIFGDTAYAGASGNSAPALAGGNAFGVGFVGQEVASGDKHDFSLVGIQGVAYVGGILSTAGNATVADVGDVVSFIVGRIDFAPNGSDDTLTLYNVTDPNLALPALPFAALSVDLDQSGFNVVSIGDAQTSIFDEIRFGASFAEVVGNVTPVEGFEAYITDPFFGLGPSEQGFNLDPDGDRLSNGLEAWFGTHPGEFDAGLEILGTDGTVATFTHPQNETRPADISGFYQWSPNLVDWYACDGVDGSPAGPGVTVSLDTVGATTTVTAVASEELDHLFLRFGVTQN